MGHSEDINRPALPFALCKMIFSLPAYSIADRVMNVLSDVQDREVGTGQPKTPAKIGRSVASILCGRWFSCSITVCRRPLWRTFDQTGEQLAGDHTAGACSTSHVILIPAASICVHSPHETQLEAKAPELRVLSLITQWCELRLAACDAQHHAHAPSKRLQL